jgi:hypothetical protein
MSEASATIRKAVHDGPSRESFLELANAFDRLRPDEVASMLSFTAKYVEFWPPEVRVAPQAWWPRVARGEELPGFRFVRVLELSSPGGGAELARSIAESPLARQLIRLSIAGEPLGDEGAAHLARTDRLVQVETLALIDASIGPEGARALLQANLHALTTLDLSGNPLTVESLEPLLRALKPRALALARCGLGAEGARRLAAVDCSARLWSLDLSGNDIGDAGVAAMSASGWFGQLLELYIASNGITARGLRALEQARWYSNLTSLDVSGNG